MIRISGLVKQYQGADSAAVNGVSLEIPTGSFFTLLGPSGCGKSTTLRCIAGLETPDAGEITIGDGVIYSRRKGINIPPYKRKIGMVFQSYAIWPHMNVLRNVEYPLHNVRGPKRKSRPEIRKAAMEALELLSMDHLAERSAPLLSGGEQQRVALARALVQDPDVLLLDEPLSNLDAKLRDQMRIELRELQNKIGVTTIYVTHDQDEAFSLSDTLAVMHKGRVAEIGRPSEVYRVSQSCFGSEFLGTSAKCAGEVVGRGPQGMLTVRTAIGDLHCRSRTDSPVGTPVWVYVRPEEVKPRLDSTRTEMPGTRVVKARITRATFLGGVLEWLAQADGVTIKGKSFSFTDESTFIEDHVNEVVELSISPARCLPAAEDEPEAVSEATVTQGEVEIGT